MARKRQINQNKQPRRSFPLPDFELILSFIITPFTSGVSTTLPHDYKYNVGDKIKYQDKNLEQTEKRIDNNVENVSRNRIPFAVHSVHPITGKRINER